MGQFRIPRNGSYLVVADLCVGPTGRTGTSSPTCSLAIYDSGAISTTFCRCRANKRLTGLRIPVDVIVKTAEEFETYKDIIG
ncbi:hypothetical protein M1O13_03940, partial [Dehalococcoidia bacterium]|nr:hypothetical protein [Dehalococcoidia bacterium]